MHQKTGEGKGRHEKVFFFAVDRATNRVRGNEMSPLFSKNKIDFSFQILHRNIDSIERRSSPSSSSSSSSASTVAPSTAGVRSGSFDAVFYLPVHAGLLKMNQHTISDY